MSHVLQLCVRLEQRPEVTCPPWVQLRNYQGEQDIEPWLEIRRRAFAREKLGVRHWNRADFEVEFLAKPWWSPARLWLAELEQIEQNLSYPTAPPVGHGTLMPVGTIAWADRGLGETAVPAVHWLAVVPQARGRGIGRLLIERLHQACWDAGYREILLETHARWLGAARLYQALGYRPVELRK